MSLLAETRVFFARSVYQEGPSYEIGCLLPLVSFEVKQTQGTMCVVAFS